MLSADDVQLNNKSDIKGESEVAFTSNNDKNIKITTSQNGAKKNTPLKSTLKAQSVNIKGNFKREDNTTYYNDEHNKKKKKKKIIDDARH